MQKQKLDFQNSSQRSIMTNTRTLKSRNQREGWYAGKHRQINPDKNWWEVKKSHRRTKYKDFGVGL